MTKFSDWLITQNQVFSLVETTLLISLSLYDLSPQKFHHACPLCIYICRASHIFVEESSSVQYSRECTMVKGTQNTTHSHLLGIVSQLNNTPFLSKSSPHTIHRV